MRVRVVTSYLEMKDPAELQPVRLERHDVEVRRVERASPDFSRFLYATAGAAWYWTDRLPWTREDWLRYLDRAALETWVLYVSGAPAGYVELERQEFGTQVEIAYFGLFPEFTGQRLGGYLLTFALERAWQPEVRRVWVHTCSLDHPAALTNYQARGMRLYKEESEDRLLPARPAKNWPESS